MSIRIKILILGVAITFATIIFCFSVGSAPKNPPNALQPITNKYILKDFNGMLAIYESNQNSPIEVLDVDISSLPERDIEKIKNGIYANTLNEIYSLAEDYE